MATTITDMVPQLPGEVDSVELPLKQLAPTSSSSSVAIRCEPSAKSKPPPPIEDETTNEGDEAEEETGNVPNLTSAQQRMSILASGEGGDSVIVDRHWNIIIFIPTFTVTMIPYMLMDDCYWSWPWNLSYLVVMAILVWVIPCHPLLPKFLHWPTMGHLWGFHREVESGRLPKFLPFYIWFLAVFNGVINTIATSVWHLELDVPKRAAQYYTSMVQTNLDWPTESDVNAAQIVGNYTGVNNGAFVAGGLLFLHFATCSNLSPSGQTALNIRRAFLKKYHTTIGTGAKIEALLKRMEDVATKRTLGHRDFTVNLKILLFSLFNALVPCIFQSKMLGMASRVAPCLTAIYIVNCLVVGTGGTIMMCLALHHVTSFFVECSEWMNQLRFLDLDLTDVRDLLLWQEIRNYYVRWRIPVEYAKAQLGFAAMMLLTCVVFTSLVIMVFLQGSKLLQVPGVQMAWFVALISAIFLVECLVQATAVWDMQQTHQTMLQDVMLKINFRLSLTATPQLKKYTKKHNLDELDNSDSEVSDEWASEKPDAKRKSSVISTGANTSGGGGDDANAGGDDDGADTAEGSTAAFSPIRRRFQGNDAAAQKTKKNKAKRSSGRFAADADVAPAAGMEVDNNISVVKVLQQATRMSVVKAEKSNNGSAPLLTRFHHASLMALLDTIERQTYIISTLDPAPSIFGISIKPTLLRVIGGYVVSAVALLVTKYFT